MGSRWVYRRPTFRVAKPKIPLFRRGTPLFPRRKAWLVRRRFKLRVRRANITGKAAAGMAIVRLVRRAVRSRRRIRKSLRPVGGAQQRGGVLTRVVRRAVRRRRLAYRRLPIPKGSAQGRVGAVVRRRLVRKVVRLRKQPKRITPGSKFTGKTGVLTRVLKAVSRMRRKMQARLRWKPRLEEIPPTIQPPTGGIHAPPRGAVFSAGSVVGEVYSAGSKRGSIY